MKVPLEARRKCHVLKTGVTDAYEPYDIGDRNWTLVFLKSSKVFEMQHGLFSLCSLCFIRTHEHRQELLVLRNKINSDFSWNQRELFWLLSDCIIWYMLVKEKKLTKFICSAEAPSFNVSSIWKYGWLSGIFIFQIEILAECWPRLHLQKTLSELESYFITIGILKILQFEFLLLGYKLGRIKGTPIAEFSPKRHR